MNVLAAILIPVVIILIAVFLLGFKVFLSKNGEFPNIHIGGNKALKNKGVHCATSQDRDAQRNGRGIDLSKILSEIDDK